MDGFAKNPHLGFHDVRDGNRPVLVPWKNHSESIRLPGHFDFLGPDRGGVLFKGPPSPKPTPDVFPKTAVKCDEPGFSLTIPWIIRGNKSLEILNIGRCAVDIYAPAKQNAFDPQVDSIEGVPHGTPYVLKPGETIKLRVGLDDPRKQWTIVQ